MKDLESYFLLDAYCRALAESTLLTLVDLPRLDYCLFGSITSLCYFVDACLRNFTNPSQPDNLYQLESWICKLTEIFSVLIHQYLFGLEFQISQSLYFYLIFIGNCHPCICQNRDFWVSNNAQIFRRSLKTQSNNWSLD